MPIKTRPGQDASEGVEDEKIHPATKNAALLQALSIHYGDGDEREKALAAIDLVNLVTGSDDTDPEIFELIDRTRRKKLAPGDELDAYERTKTYLETGKRLNVKELDPQDWAQYDDVIVAWDRLCATTSGQNKLTRAVRGTLGSTSAAARETLETPTKPKRRV